MGRRAVQAMVLRHRVEEIGRRLSDYAAHRGHQRLSLLALELLPFDERLERMEQLLAAPPLPLTATTEVLHPAV